jgi:hypothetical protein
MKHNKKRNTAFLYEVLLREGTRGALDGDVEKIKLVKNIILEHFSPNSELYKELKLYKSLEENSVEQEFAEKFIKEVEQRYQKLNKRAIFNEQTQLINKINKTLGIGLYNSFVPNYKDLATISQIFNDATPIKEKILLEQTIINKIKIVDENKNRKVMQPIDNIVYSTFSRSFNEKYSSLLKEQKDLLNKFVGSFENNGLEFKIFLNEELERLKNEIKKSVVREEISSDKNMVIATNKTLDYLSKFKEVKEISEDMLQKVLKIQQFVHEVNN